MNCAETSDLLHAYSDGELDLVRALELEKHLAGCAACSRAHENIRDLKTTFKASGQYFNAPAGLKRRIRTAIQPETPNARRPAFGWWNLFKVAIPVVGVALIAMLMLPALSGRSADQRLAQEVTSSHVRSLMADHRTDIASSDQHTVKPWFEGKLDFAPPVVDLADRGFPLVGGRLDYLHDRSVASLVYQRHKHVINLFIWPAPTDSKKAERMVTRQGYNLIHWNASGMIFWAISDLNQAELKEFVHLLK
jgi:anti-sigma factor RsiW